jgi:DNA-binding transcriptional MerR regulator
MEQMAIISDLTIQEASDQLGLPKSTIRYWEKEFHGFITPTRTTGGQRRYSESDIAVIASIRNFKKMGIALSRIKRQMLRTSMPLENVNPFLIDQLAKRIANTVRKEIYDFFDPDWPTVSDSATPRDKKNDIPS